MCVLLNCFSKNHFLSKSIQKKKVFSLKIRNLCPFSKRKICFQKNSYTTLKKCVFKCWCFQKKILIFLFLFLRGTRIFCQKKKLYLPCWKMFLPRWTFKKMFSPFKKIHVLRRPQ